VNVKKIYARFTSRSHLKVQNTRKASHYVTGRCTWPRLWWSHGKSDRERNGPGCACLYPGRRIAR